MTEFQIRKDSFTTTRLVEDRTATVDLPDGGVLAKVDRFAVTANNVTYAATGDRIGYWQFFPPTPEGDDSDAKDWGLMPVWGFADVIRSDCAEVPVGERLFGYWPPANHLVLLPQKVSGQHFFDGAAHRAQLPSGYNMYRRVGAEDATADSEALRMLLWPLYLTSFCLADALQDNDWFGAEQVIVLSASSKTSIGLAYGLREAEAPGSVGVTSQRNLEMVKELGIYDTVATYDDLSAVDCSLNTAIVDMSGNGTVLAELHRRLGDAMVKTYFVGLTHWDQAGPQPGMIQERSEFFFAPSHIERRMAEWGPAEFNSKSTDFVERNAAKTSAWLTVNTLDGLSALGSIFDDVCAGRVAPDQGLVVQL